MYKLIAIDVDGTLINFNNPRVSSRVKDAVKKAMDKGIKVTINTGRNFRSMATLIKDLVLDDYVITSNGTVIVNPLSQEIISQVYLHDEYARGILELLEKRDIPHISFSGLYCYSHSKYKDIPMVKNLLLEEDNMHLYETKEDIHYVPNFNKYTAMGDSKELERIVDEINERFGDKVTVECGLKDHIDVFPKGVDKGTALITLTEALNIPLNQVMAIGDSDNDLTMLNIVGLGIAMENGFESAREKADFVTKSVEEDGVAYAIEKFIL